MPNPNYFCPVLFLLYLSHLTPQEKKKSNIDFHHKFSEARQQVTANYHKIPQEVDVPGSIPQLCLKGVENGCHSHSVA